MQHIPLEVDRDLLDAKFDSYKVSLDNIHFESKRLEQSLCLRSPSNSTVSLQHMKVFSNENQLFVNEEKSSDSYEYMYRILDTGHIQELRFNKMTRQWDDLIMGCIDLETSTSGFPVNVIFTEYSLVVVSNGVSQISVYLDVNKHSLKMLTWKLPNCAGLALIEARVIDDKLNFLAQEVENCEEEEDRKKKIRSRIHWLVINLDDIDTCETLTIEKTTEFVQYGHFETCTFAENGDIIFLASEKPVYENDDDELAVKEQSWSQKGDIVEVNFLLESLKLAEEDVSIDVTKTSIKLTVKDVVLLNGKLGGEIDEKAVEVASNPKDRILILKLKSKSAEKWKKLIVLETKKMEAAVDEEMTKEGKEDQQVYGGEEPMEECDEADKTMLFYWVDRKTLKVIAQCDASGSQVLFTRHHGFHPATFCLRHDVDGLIWSFDKPEVPKVKAEEDVKEKGKVVKAEPKVEPLRPPRHVATLNAFGYVQASKTSRTWSGCSPDYSLACIVESGNRVLLYSQKVEVSGKLSNRKTAQKVSHVAQQRLLRVDCPHAIRGVYMTNTHIFAATKEHIHVAELSF